MDGGESRPPRVCDVPIEHLSFIWPQARGFLVKVIERDGRCNPADVLALLLAGKAKLWISWDGEAVEAAIVTDMIQYPRIKELRIWLVGGRNLRAWATEARDMLEAYARAHGCGVIVGGMRRGWIRIGGPGWHETGTAFEKRLD